MNESFHNKNIDGATGTTSGAAIPSAGVKNFTLVMQGSGGSVGATVVLEGSPDGTNWYAIGDDVDGSAVSIALAAAGISAVSVSDQAHNMVRARVSAHTAGTINAWVTGG